MEVKIGIADTGRELVVQSKDDADKVKQIVTDALAGKSDLLELTDEKGRQVLVPLTRIAYVELGAPHTRTVGFAAT
ncbi:DUF3107 domain-containing protein [Tsukamurella sp. 8F]|uniref:DUF3107 domain-containing protein n=1 Tax=unclassified Tsukamurella TaxID=2633480 RepID=UPI0023BA3027|nr:MULTISPECIES: DUF3107 domain-containing protein [unclassified Tsukamurella]MDF0528916.1 DUF3107 domain-containing protein [Tsukamurella sp. 8J]MDF0586751.1 DUF3107 domain-containing protein [Tsukamurella sp. 8F]